MSDEPEFESWATRELDAFDQHGTHTGTVAVTLGRPAQEPTGAWACPYRVTGAGDDAVYRILGLDGIHALQCAFVVIGWKLAGFTGELRWNGEPDLGFPVPPEEPDQGL
jgi:hypothetical protein